MGISDRIRRLCKMHNITINRLERELGIGRGNVARWDNHAPSSERLSKVATFFGVSTDYLMGISVDALVDDAEYEFREVEKAWEKASDKEKEDLALEFDLKREALEDMRFAQAMQRQEQMRTHQDESTEKDNTASSPISDRDIRAAFFNGYSDDLSEDEQAALWADAQAYMAFKLSQRKKKVGD